jgi:hypothetical protein
MRRVALLAIISSLLAPCGIAEAGVLWASVPGPAPASTLYQIDPMNGHVLGSSVLPTYLHADDLAFSNDRQSFWVLDASTSYVSLLDLNGYLLQQFFVNPGAMCLAVLPDNTVAIGGTNGIDILDPATGAEYFFASGSGGEISGLASNGVDLIYSFDIYGQLFTYDRYGNVLMALQTDTLGDSRDLAYTGTSFLIESTGSTIREIDPVTGELIRSFQGPTGFTGLEYRADQQPSPNPVPEPASVIMMLIGAGFTLVWRRRNL